MIDIRLHHEGIVYGTLHWKEGTEWDAWLDLNHVSPEYVLIDLEAWTLAVGATKLWLHGDISESKTALVADLLIDKGTYQTREIVDLARSKYCVEKQT